jgi:hypothetical protein
MAKSFKICPVRHFDVNAFSQGRTSLNQQPHFAGMDDEVPTTTIRSSQSNPGFADFRPYVIAHDRVVRMAGRYGSVRFPEFTYTGEIAAFYSEQRMMLLLSGKKNDVLSLVTSTTRVTEFQIDTLHIDMNALQGLLPSVNLVWFKYHDGMVRASALMGAHVERTDAYAQSKLHGDISTLSFYFEDLSGDVHPIMVVEDGTVVLQAQYAEISEELNLVNLVYDRLLNDISQHVPPKISGKTFSVSETPPL